MTKYNVLVFPCGSVTAMDINFSLRHAMRINLYGASSIEDHGRFIYKNYIGNVPNIADAEFIPEFEKILQEYKIDFVIPTHDSVALCLVENQQNLSATIITADLDTTKVCRYKSLTYAKLKKYGFTPKIYTYEERKDIQYPLFLKPDDGQGGKNSYLVNNAQDLEYYHTILPNHLICEYLPGSELTVDCFTDRHGTLRFVCERSRDRLLAGVSVHAKILPLEPYVQKIAEDINKSLKFRGYWYFQLKKDKNNQYKLLEISTRLAGTACLSKQLDVNFSLLSVFDFANQEISINPNDIDIEVDRALFGRYSINYEYERVYIDLDDTLIFADGTYNSLAMMYLYQCVNKGIEIILITKHDGGLDNYFNQKHLSKELFTDIYLLKPDLKKSEYINPDKKSIFIDNSFVEREDVRQKHHIPCFDVSNIECLLDWRG